MSEIDSIARDEVTVPVPQREAWRAPRLHQLSASQSEGAPGAGPEGEGHS